jgi:hypothetical protein
LAGVIATALAACSDAPVGDPHAPGEQLGTFAVAASLAESTCGAGALGAPDRWQFEVRLSRSGSYLYWLNGREAIPGTIARDGASFSFDSLVRVEVEPAERGDAGCTLVRTDRATGKLALDDDGANGFDADLVYGYTAEAGSDCTSVIAVEGGFHRLPCEIGYRLEAERLDGP